MLESCNMVINFSNEKVEIESAPKFSAMTHTLVPSSSQNFAQAFLESYKVSPLYVESTKKLVGKFHKQ